MFIDIARLLQAHNNPPNYLLTWLNHPMSLTDKLRDFSGDAELEVLKQYWTSPNWWDKQVLGIAEKSVFHRDILMFSHQIPCWYARSIIPEQTYKANDHFFNRLTHESLGSIVFSESNVARVQLVNYPITPQCIEYYWLPNFLKREEKEISDSQFFNVPRLGGMQESATLTQSRGQAGGKDKERCNLLQKEQLWTRLSLFTAKEGLNFYLIEILLPGLLGIMK
ncbi:MULTISPECIES: chorismate--pyruvate lyase family protein [Legionella]|uniref:4-hydroxybenzoate synthetase n=1 Tax=Legionella maceachernii TaxID=466 RepID=A0A0W0WEI6_9GAMM|nr:chorismate lyase [Legionella maceachernii]KTD30670.1 4-hydroxybenzoate synthetase [Legionella maceachernii]SJZ80693.1 chorismate--pyruvate lyase [Legionella maceachernii]SUP02821.1 chorismate pyruvate lyase [Legionella maceachernii]